jgi:hypothetical protein
MRVCDHDLRFTRFHAVKSGGNVCGASCLRSRLVFVVLSLLILAGARQAYAAPSFQLLQAPGGLGGNQVGNNYTTSFGTMNALGLGAPLAGLTVATLNSGAQYFTQYQILFQGLGAGQNARLTVYVSTNFAHPLAQVVQNCPSTAACNTSGGYSNMSTLVGAPSTVIASMNNSTATAGLGIFLPDNDGASAFTGADTTGVITLTMIDVSTNAVLQTATLAFNAAPSNTVQNAVQLTLATAAGGLTVTPASDFSMNFGNVNGLGFGPAAGLSTTAVAGGVVYSTPYLLKPVFTDFNSTTATIKVFVSTNFAHPTLLIMRDAAASAGPWLTNIGLTAGTATQITNTAADRSSITRFLGLFVSNINGATSFRGNDSATLTFTLTVP